MNEENSVIVIDQQEQHKKKGALAVILAIAFVAILGIGGTFAYLTYSANQSANRFTTVPASLSADLVEPAWNKGVTESEALATPKKASDGTAIPVNASEMVAGSSVDKNPFVINTSWIKDNKVAKASDAFCAVKLTFQKWVQTENTTAQGSGEYVDMTADELSKLLKVYNIAGNSATDTTAAVGINVNKTWINFADAAYDGADDTTKDAANTRYYYYGSADKLTMLNAMCTATDYAYQPVTEDETQTYWGYTPGTGPASTTIFDKITYNKDASAADIQALSDMLGKVNPGWKVVVKAAVIQASDQIKPTAVEKEFKNLLDSTNTPTSASGWRTDTTYSKGTIYSS